MFDTRDWLIVWEFWEFSWDFFPLLVASHFCVVESVGSGGVGESERQDFNFGSGDGCVCVFGVFSLTESSSLSRDGTIPAHWRGFGKLKGSYGVAR